MIEYGENKTETGCVVYVMVVPCILSFFSHSDQITTSGLTRSSHLIKPFWMARIDRFRDSC